MSKNKQACKKDKNSIKIFGIVLILIIFLVFSYQAGRFTQWFDLNMCYSAVINQIRTEEKKGKDGRFKDMLDKIETRGYETECHEIEETIQSYK